MIGEVIHTASFCRPGCPVAGRPDPRLPAGATSSVPVSGNCVREPARGGAGDGAPGFTADGGMSGCGPFRGRGAALPLVLSSAPMSARGEGEPTTTEQGKAGRSEGGGEE